MNNNTSAVYPAQPPLDPNSNTIKRRKLSIQVSLEAGADGRPTVQEVFPDGTYTPAVDSHLDRTSAAASAFVARALAAPPPSTSAAAASVETRGTDLNPSTQWATTAFTCIEGAIWEMGRAIGALEALRSDTPLLQLNRTTPRTRTADALQRDGAALLMAKSQSMRKCADAISARADALTKCAAADNAFCDSYLKLRKLCRGLRRAPDGTPLIDIGDVEFVPIRRPSDIITSTGTDHPEPSAPVDDVYNNVANNSRPLPQASPQQQQQQKQQPQAQPQAHVQQGQQQQALQQHQHQQPVVTSSNPSAGSVAPLRINYPAPVFLLFGVQPIEDEIDLPFAPVMHEGSAHAEENSIQSVVRRIRLSRVSAFRRHTFELLAKQASTLPHVVDLSTTSVTVDSGPNELLRVQQTHRAASSMPIDVDLLSLGAQASRVQLASLLQTVAIHCTLSHKYSNEAHFLSSQTSLRPVVDRLLTVTTSHALLASMERILDNAVRRLHVRVEWTRGPTRTEEVRVRVYSTEADGDGGERHLVTMEPISSLNNGGHATDNGHVRVVPAFGVIIPTPDDPTLGGRSMTGNTSSGIGLDDVPRAFVCPVGGELMSVLTLLLCIRLLDSLEIVARASVRHILDVDRQCFTVIVSSPRNGHLLKGKVWPQGEQVGLEVPGLSVWLNNKKVEAMASMKSGRLTAWKKLVEGLGGAKIVNEPKRSPSKDVAMS